jgi:uncharacterized membrane protein YdbT with pleckstrin-like domain
MADIDAKLLTGEEVVFQTKKHWFAPLSDSIWAILMILGSFVVAWLQTDATTGIVGFANRILGLIELGLFLGGVGWIIYNIVAWTTAQYAVTNRRVFAKEGLIHSRSTDTLLTSVSDVRTAVPFFGKMLGFGKISIMSASGESGADTFTSVRKVEDFKQQILEQKTANPGPAAGGVAAPAPGAPTSAAALPPASDGMATLTGLAKLRDEGAITPAEYEAKKQEVLSRI